MESTKRKSWKVPLIALCILITILVWLAFGERGLIGLYRTEMERQAHIERIRELVEENQALLEEIQRLRTDTSYIESVARKELNLIRENEVVYKFDNEQDNGAPNKASSGQKRSDGTANFNRRGTTHGESQ